MVIPYIFVGATIFSIVPLLVLFKINIERVQNDPDNFNQIQKRYFIAVTVSKILPVLLLVLGIVVMTEVPIQQLIIPWLIILLALIYGIYYILSFKKRELKGAAKEAVNALSSMSLPFIFSIPILAAFFLFMMAN